MKKIIITLDGYSSCGKSTLAKQMAAHLNYVFIDSGAMYRAITLYFIRHIFSVAQQQLMGAQKGIVMDGRDIGTAVFPGAELKIFVTASPEVRVERRYQELVAKDPAITKAEIQANLEMRDHIDSTREFSPLKKAHDALVLDNSSLTRDEQLELALSWAKERIESA